MPRKKKEEKQTEVEVRRVEETLDTDNFTVNVTTRGALSPTITLHVKDENYSSYGSYINIPADKVTEAARLLLLAREVERGLYHANG